MEFKISDDSDASDEFSDKSERGGVDAGVSDLAPSSGSLPSFVGEELPHPKRARQNNKIAVSYTHLTLPTKA